MAVLEPRIEGPLASFEGHSYEKDSRSFHTCEKKASGDKTPNHISGPSYLVNKQLSHIVPPRRTCLWSCLLLFQSFKDYKMVGQAKCDTDRQFLSS